MIALWAVEQDATRQRARRSRSPMAVRSAARRAGLIASSFAEEAEADLFNEQAVVWGGVPELLIAGFETLVAGGVSPEVAYLECVGELKLIAELIEARGIAGMREAISNTAELGALLGGRRIVDESVRERMAEVLREVRAGPLRRRAAAGGSERLCAAGEARATKPRETLLERDLRRLSGADGSSADRLRADPGARRRSRVRDRRAAACDAPLRRPDSPRPGRAPALRPRAARNRCGPGLPWRGSLR